MLLEHKQTKREIKEIKTIVKKKCKISRLFLNSAAERKDKSTYLLSLKMMIKMKSTRSLAS